MADSVPDDSTLPDDQSPREVKREKWLRELTISLVILFVGLGAFGILGVRTSTATNIGNGYRIDVTYAAVTRGGLATPFAIKIRTTDGSALPRNVTLRVSSDYLAILDDNGMEPTPVRSSNSSGFTSWDFEVPTGSATLDVALDARLEPAVQWGETASVELWANGERRASTEIRTWVVP